MDKEKFITWLIGRKKMGEKSARDVISRCRRVERTLTVSLDNVVKNEKEMGKILNRLKAEAPSYLSPKTNAIYAVAVLRRAVKLYCEYKSLKNI